METRVYDRRTDWKPAPRPEWVARLNEEGRVRMWDRIIRWMEDGTIPKSQFANVIYLEFCADPMAAIRKAYQEIGLTMTPISGERIKTYLDNKPKGVFGRHDYKTGRGETGAAAEERKALRRYQDYFGVPSEG